MQWGLHTETLERIGMCVWCICTGEKNWHSWARAFLLSYWAFAQCEAARCVLRRTACRWALAAHTEAETAKDPRCRQDTQTGPCVGGVTVCAYVHSDQRDPYKSSP